MGLHNEVEASVDPSGASIASDPLVATQALAPPMDELVNDTLIRWPPLPSNNSSARFPLVAIVTGLPVPMVRRSVTSISPVEYGAGGTMKSLLLTSVPSGVRTEIRPELVAPGTSMERLVGVAAVTRARVWLIATMLFRAVGSKLVPVMVTEVPAVPDVGVKPEMVGAEKGATVNGSLLVADPPGAVTLTGPVVAPAGAVATSRVVVAEVTVAVVPLNLTTLLAAVALNPVPEMVTEVPAGPRRGEMARIATWEEGWRVIEVRLPAGS